MTSINVPGHGDGLNRKLKDHVKKFTAEKTLFQFDLWPCMAFSSFYMASLNAAAPFLLLSSQ